MIFTVGHCRSYESARRRDGKVIKLGRGDAYPGGICFRTRAQAMQYLVDEGLDDEFAVFGLLAEWAADTAPPEHPSRRHEHQDLLRDAEVAFLDTDRAMLEAAS